MFDIKLNDDGDIAVSEFGDISTTRSIRQAVLVRLRWIYKEWRLGPDRGFPWFEDVFVKNPNIARLRQLVRSKIMEVEGVMNAEVTSLDYDRRQRRMKLTYSCVTTEETYREEVTIYG